MVAVGRMVQVVGAGRMVQVVGEGRMVQVAVADRTVQAVDKGRMVQMSLTLLRRSWVRCFCSRACCTCRSVSRDAITSSLSQD